MFNDVTSPPRNRWRWLKVLIILALIAGLLVLGGVIYVRQWYNNGLKPVNTSAQEEILFSVQTGDPLRRISANLKEKDLIHNTTVFERYVTNTGASDLIKAGTYKLRQSMSVEEIVNIMTEGRVATDLVTILPGQRIDQIRKAFIDAKFDAAEVDAALDPKQYVDHPALTDKPADASLEGYLYPESFQRTDTTQVSEIVAQSLDEMQKRLTPDVRAGIAKQGLSLHEGVTLASVIEREVSSREDRKTVAQIFLSRLKINMPLGADATFFYAAATTGQVPTPDLDSPYNTRRYPGLPPGPISNVSETSLVAVAAPAGTDWLYFVSGDDGNTYFSRTQEDHEALTREHCKELCKLPDTVPE